MSFPLYHYRATTIRVVDGDTAWLRIDRGFHEFYEVACRLFGVNAPELSTGAPGYEARTWLTERITSKTLFVVSNSLDKYGRPLVTLFDPEPVVPDFKLSINAELIASGNAVVMR